MWEQWCVRAKDDWLAIVNEYDSAQLLNPYTGHRVELSPITIVVTPGVRTNHAFHRIVMCPSSSDIGDGYLIIGMIANELLQAIVRDGDENLVRH